MRYHCVAPLRTTPRQSRVPDSLVCTSLTPLSRPFFSQAAQWTENGREIESMKRSILYPRAHTQKNPKKNKKNHSKQIVGNQEKKINLYRSLSVSSSFRKKRKKEKKWPSTLTRSPAAWCGHKCACTPFDLPARHSMQMRSIGRTNRAIVGARGVSLVHS